MEFGRICGKQWQGKSGTDFQYFRGRFPTLVVMIGVTRGLVEQTSIDTQLRTTETGNATASLPPT